MKKYKERFLMWLMRKVICSWYMSREDKKELLYTNIGTKWDDVDFTLQINRYPVN